MSVLAHSYGRVFAFGMLPVLVLVGAAQAGAPVDSADAEPPHAIVSPLGEAAGEFAAQAGGETSTHGLTGGPWSLVSDLFRDARQYLLAIFAMAFVLAVVAMLTVWWLLTGRPEGVRTRLPRNRRERAEQMLPELRNSVGRVRRLAKNLREDEMWTEWLDEMPDPRSDESPVEDRLRLVEVLEAKLNGVRQETEAHRQTISRLVDERQRAGFHTEALRDAANLGPASAIARLLSAVEELELQRMGSQARLEDLQERIDEARQLCNREIANVAMRRFPLGILGVADDMLKLANTDEEVAARREVVEGILDNIYRQYFPGAQRRRR